MRLVSYRSLAGTALLTAALASSPHATAASGSTSVSVDFPEIIILHYRSALTISFTGDVDSATDEGAAATISVPLGSAGGDGALIPSGTATTTVPVKVKNMWAVRGITSTGNFAIDAAITTDTATNGTSSTTMSDLKAAAGGSVGASITVASGGMAIPNAVLGGITFDLDVTDVTQTGAHTGIVYTITASAP